MSDIALTVVVNKSLRMSMNSGRACAQVSHATSNFHLVNERLYDNKDTLSIDYNIWKNQTHQDFGTIYVKESTMDDIEFLHHALAQRVPNPKMSGLIFDPSYGIHESGYYMEAKNVLTCAWFFGSWYDSDLDRELRSLDFLGTPGDLYV